jgi:iron complex transport system substrate-binding protein
MVCRLGLRGQLVGVTHECDYPPDVTSLPKITRTLIPHDATSRDIDALVRNRLRTQKALYTLDHRLLEELAPDLIVTQGLCDVCAVAQEEVEEAACSLPRRPRVINLEPACLDDVLACLTQIGDAAGIADRAATEVRSLRSRITAVEHRSSAVSDPLRVTLLEWIDPPFTSGHWGPELVQLAGGREGIGVRGEKSRTMSWDEVLAWRPEVLFIACCGFNIERTLADLPILKRQPGWSNLPCVRDRRVYVADGSAYFSRPGPRLVDSLEMLAHALHPDVHPLPPGVPAALRVEV